MTKDFVLLIVEDQAYELQSYVGLARKSGMTVIGVTNETSALQTLEKQKVDGLLTDIYLTDDRGVLEGITLVREALSLQPALIPLIMSSSPDERVYLKAMEVGALFALKKPLICADEIAIAIRAAREKRTLRIKKGDENRHSSKLTELCPDGLHLGEGTRKWVEVAAEHSHLPVVIYGETGTGKEEIARLIHNRRVAKEGDIPFQAVNCALLEGDLAASLLFGHKKGSFSGAYSTTDGYIGGANGGILFLDEIHTLPLSCQQKLLRVLNDGTYSRIGDAKSIFSRFQVIAASTRDLDDAVEDRSFLLDLRVRLTGIDIPLAPLRERREDIPTLVRLFFVKNGTSVQEEDLIRIIERCQEYYWQGNIRQLFQCLQALTALSLAEGIAPCVKHLPELKSMRAPLNKR
ncbi:MAG: sigma-54-dependent Fis family transcriptional regulator [Deltaproteobacteria bacterium]|nr:sigma-54-dependent Fis family transcriptional regulator [Deltaproteobacteria bacterium]